VSLHAWLDACALSGFLQRHIKVFIHERRALILFCRVLLARQSILAKHLTRETFCLLRYNSVRTCILLNSLEALAESYKMSLFSWEHRTLHILFQFWLDGLTFLALVRVLTTVDFEAGPFTTYSDWDFCYIQIKCIPLETNGSIYTSYITLKL
jgi:hypothetical protein